MKIGIIGAGQIGGTLTRRLTALGHQVSVANSRGPETLADLAAETGAKPVSVAEARLRRRLMWSYENGVPPRRDAALFHCRTGTKGLQW